MKKSFVLIFSLVMFLSFQVSNAQMASGLEVEEMEICTSVEDRVPVGADTSFLNSVEQVYCFTKLSGGADTTAVSHVWYYNDEEMARVDLNVYGKTWRTWSSKRIVESWTGKWRVDVVSETGEVVESKEFTVRAVAE
jgi:hypothetical protein